MTNILVRGQAPGILIISNSYEEFEEVGKARWWWEAGDLLPSHPGSP